MARYKNEMVLKDNICMMCSRDIPKGRVSLSVTCGPNCARKYKRVFRYIHQSFSAKYKTYSKQLIKILSANRIDYHKLVLEEPKDE